MSKRKSKVDNGYLAAVTNAHIGEALGADRQDLEEHPPAGGNGRRGFLRLFGEAWKQVLAFLARLRKPGHGPGS